ncbi:glucose-1-phosphate adenylyltransferase [Candidatus Methylomirabilis limnetica]|uniref:Glucose-1-phosphate adenylyltransferase n=1 Tax=Candidatus Methylomirabilis limnetica TaxID=2033718 RepID=A0A2T4TV63_9BACT|nr:glucose-1-phosphate adenylyltransferase [Candidatus Methylomirabilis limnetica]PTL35003.1 glucose-1-phosphate adenylyltransferase [Candidatus Methylomirabilis limnetica]
MITRSPVVAVIMGGGRGTRLYPLTKERCKPAVPLAGKYRLVDIPISNCLNSGINRIFLLTQFNTASLHRHIQNTYNFDPFGGGFVDILSAEQTEKTTDWYQGTADAVRRNLTHFRTYPHDLVLVLSGDQLYRMDFRQIIDQHIRTAADVTISAIALPTSAIAGLGLMRVHDDLSIDSFVEKPKDPEVIQSLAVSPAIEQLLKTRSTEKRCLASMGIYVFKREVLQEALDNNMTDFGKEIIPGLLGKKRLFSHLFEGYWEDIGTVRAFFEANLQLAHPLPSFNFFTQIDPIYTHARYLPATKVNLCTIDHAIIGDGSIISQAHIKRCVVGIRSVLREGVDLEDVVMMGADYYESDVDFAANAANGIPNIGIGRNCHFRTAIIDKNARIGDNVTLNPVGKPNGHVRDGIAIVDGILVVSKGAIVPAGTVV